MYNLAVLFLRYDQKKYYKAFDDLQMYLKKVKTNTNIVIIDNKCDIEENIENNIHYINGDNTHWEFSGWDCGIKYLNNNNIKYDAILFVNDSFMNDGSGGTPDTLINNEKILQCIKNNKPIQSVLNVGMPDHFKINNIETDIRGRSHCFILSKPIVNELEFLVSLDLNFIDKCIEKSPSKPYFKKDAPLNNNLKYFIEGWLGGYWHSAFKFEENWYLFRMKTLAFLNELMLAQRIKDLDKNYKYNIKNSDVVIFDVFDTCLFRKFKQPHELHYHMGQSFLGDRVEAEKRTVKKIENPNINEIYNIGNLPFFKLQQEINLEKSVCYRNSEIFELYKYAKQLNKEVIFLSDMYLQSNIIKELLESNGYENPKVFASNEIKLRKDSGNAYILMKSLYPDKNILMIGDNEHSDYKMAIKNKINAIHYKKQENIEDFWFKVGYNSVGSMAYSYVLWLEEQFRTKGIDKVYFFSREGDLFNKIYNKIKKEDSPESELLYLSRKSLNIPLLSSISKIDFFNNNEYSYIKWYLCFTVASRSTEEYCNYFGIKFKDVSDRLYNKGLLFDDLDKISISQKEYYQTKILEEIYEDVQNISLNKLDNLKKYLNKNIKTNNENIAIVDLGYGGSIQESFIRVLHGNGYDTKNIECFLLAPEDRLNSRINKYAFNTFLDMNNPTFTKNAYLIECLFNAPFGSCLEYNEDGEAIFDEEDCSYCNYIHNGVLNFVEDSKFMTIGNYQKLGLFRLNCLINSPTEEESKYIGSLKLYSSGTSGFGEYIGNPDLSCLIEQYNKSRNKNMFNENIRRMFKEWDL